MIFDHLTESKMTLGEILERTANRLPDKIAIIWEEEKITYKELNDNVNKVANSFLDLGIKPGDSIGFLINKRPELIITFLAAARMGAVATPINFKLNPDKIRYQFEHIQMKAILLEKEFLSIYEEVKDLLNDKKKVFYIGEENDLECNNWSNLLKYPSSYPKHNAHHDDIVYLNYTSGSTGKPKGAITTHSNIIWNALSNFETFKMYESDVFLGMFSTFSHPHELFHRSMYLGCTAVLVDSLNPRIVAESIQKHNVTWMMAVPSFYEMLFHQARSGKMNISSLRCLEAGGSFIDAKTLKDMEERFNIPLMPVWGSTETTGVGLALVPSENRKPGSVGKPCAFYEFKVVNEEGLAVNNGEVGEMAVKGPAVVSGYINLKEENESQFRNGWYYTQDLVSIDNDGFFYFVARKSEMLKIGGIRVYPVEIESVIKTHPEVSLVVVVRAEEKLRGEIARAVVVKKSNSSLTSKELRAYCLKNLAVYQVPRVIEFWESLPHLPNGKIDKKTIIETQVRFDSN